MVARLLSLLFGCRHKRVTRPITPARKPGAQPGIAYVACLDCGQYFHYDVEHMTMGERIPMPAHDHSPDSGRFQSQV